MSMINCIIRDVILFFLVLNFSSVVKCMDLTTEEKFAAKSQLFFSLAASAEMDNDSREQLLSMIANMSVPQNILVSFDLNKTLGLLNEHSLSFSELTAFLMSVDDDKIKSMGVVDNVGTPFTAIATAAERLRRGIKGEDENKAVTTLLKVDANDLPSVSYSLGVKRYGDKKYSLAHRYFT